MLPVFALANAGVVWTAEVLSGRGALVAGLVAGLVVGKPVGIFLGARLASSLRIGVKPASYTWRQLAGAGALGGIGFTMSLFIAGQAFDGDDFAAAKVAIFAASLAAGVAGALILWPRVAPDEGSGAGSVSGVEFGTPVNFEPEPDAVAVAGDQ